MDEDSMPHCQMGGLEKGRTSAVFSIIGCRFESQSIYHQGLPDEGSVNAFDPALWETFVSMTLGLEVPILAALPRLHNSPLAKCGCKKFCMDFHGDHTSSCTAHSGATKAPRLDGKRARAVVVPYGRTLGQNTARRHGQRRPMAWRCGGEELPEGSRRESKLSL